MNTSWPKTLKETRVNMGLSLRRAAEKSGLSNSYISQLENGKIENPSIGKVRMLMNVYGINFNDLLDDKETEKDMCAENNRLLNEILSQVLRLRKGKK